MSERDRPELRQIGRAVRRARLQAGMTQAQLAQRLDVNPTYVTNVEAGRVNPTVTKLAELSEALGAAFTVRLALPPDLTPKAPDEIEDPRTPPGQLRREALLDSVADFVLENGVIDFSLRQAAIASGTTYRVLLYYFGSAPELIREALDRIRQRRAENATKLLRTPGNGALTSAWAILTADAPAARALLEGLALAVAQPEDFAAIAVDGVDQYLPFVEAFAPPEMDAEQRMRVATLSLAIIRGLMLDWLATRDKERTDAAMADFEQVAIDVGWMRPPSS